MINKEDLLDDAHWQNEGFSQRVTSNQWKGLLLQNDDKIIWKGRVRQLVAKRLGYGVVEIFKQPFRP